MVLAREGRVMVKLIRVQWQEAGRVEDWTAVDWGRVGSGGTELGSHMESPPSGGTCWCWISGELLRGGEEVMVPVATAHPLAGLWRKT
jgi:hypothetical protein